MSPRSQPSRLDLNHDSFVEHYESFLDVLSANKLLEAFLSDGFPWEHQTIRGVKTRRANAWFATDPDFIYRYSGQTWIPNAMTPEIGKLAAQLSQLCRCEFNSVLGSLYPDGQAGVSWHDDNDFPSLPDQPIATISFGSQRRFKIRQKCDHQIVAQYDIPHGSVVIMGGAMQRHFDHAIFKTSKKVGPRVNLSYRCFQQ